MWRNDDLYRALWRCRAGPTRSPPIPSPPPRRQAHGSRAAGVPAHARHRSVHRVVDARGREHGGAHRRGRPRSRTRVVRGRTQPRRSVLTIVGDVFARPLLAALDAAPGKYDLSSLRAITSSGVTFSPDAKAGLMQHLPGVTIIDSLGSSEGIMTRSESRTEGDIAPARFAVNERVAVLDEVTGARVEPGSGEVGLLGVTGPIPLGYWGDDAKTRRHVPRRRRRALVDPRRLRDRRGRRHRQAARPRVGVHQHRRREGVPRRSRARAARAPRRRRLRRRRRARRTVRRDGGRGGGTDARRHAATKTRSPSSPRRASRGTSDRGGSSSSTTSSAAPPARPTTTCSATLAAEQTGSHHMSEPIERGSRPAHRQSMVADGSRRCSTCAPGRVGRRPRARGRPRAPRPARRPLRRAPHRPADRRDLPVRRARSAKAAEALVAPATTP